MKNLLSQFEKLNIYAKTLVISSLFMVLFAIASIPFIFLNLEEITNGLLLGTFISAIFYFFYSLLETKNVNDKKYKITIILLVLRLLLFTGILISIAYSYYKANFKIFNVFSYVIGYLIPLVIYIILNVVKGSKKQNVR